LYYCCVEFSNAVNNFDRTNPTTAQVSDLLVIRVTVTRSKLLILLKLVVGMCPWCACHWEDFFSVLSYHRRNAEYADDAFSGCLCGKVHYEIGAEPITTRVCWCRDCQKLGAGGATVSAAFPSSALKVTGKLRDYPSTADSGNKMHRKFCPTCGTHLFSEAEARAHLVFVRVGTLENPEIAKPSATIWISSARVGRPSTRTCRRSNASRRRPLEVTNNALPTLVRRE
jgi:hypothetical protein